MNTPAHLLIGTAAFGRAGQPRVTAAAMLGAIAPDLSLYLMTAWSVFVLGVSPDTVFREFYFSAEWQMVFAVDNSFILWGIGFAGALWAGHAALRAFCGAGLLHLACDFPLHNDDARMHFWPATDWVFHSPVSYWDNRYYGGVVGTLELILSFALCLALWRRFDNRWARGAIGTMGVALLASGFMWAFLLGSQAQHSH